MMDPFLAKLPDDLRSKVIGVVNVVPEALPIFEEIYKHASSDMSGQSRKLRRVEVEESKKDLRAPDKSQIIFSIEDASILSPVRKKLNFILHLSSDDRKPMLSLVKGDKTELSIDDLKNNIKMATFLPVAEKENNIYIFISYGRSVDNKHTEPILMTLNKGSMLTHFKQAGLVDVSVDDFTKCIEYMRKQAILAGFRIADPFFSNHQSTDQNASFHVECHRGTKEGTLYFLPDHIIFGFKKPILLFNSSDIESITYSSITRLTFNVTLVTNNEEKYEFSMIDQNEYSKIDDYVKKKQVKDKSMSEELKAKSKSKANQGPENEHLNSALEEATQKFKTEPGLPNVDLNSEDDEEADQNFEAESDLSDGSDEESGADEDEDKPGSDPSETEEGSTPDGNENINLQENNNTALELEDIPIEVDEDEDDDDEGSGVEYD